METVTVLLIVVAIVLLALAGVAFFLMLQKRGIERSAVERADELVAENLNEEVRPSDISDFRAGTLDEKAQQAA